MTARSSLIFAAPSSLPLLATDQPHRPPADAPTRRRADAPTRREMMQRWAAYLDKLAAGADILQFRAA